VLLLYFPGGLAELGYRARDAFLRRVAARHDLLVPSLVADTGATRSDNETGDLIRSAAGTGASIAVTNGADTADSWVPCPTCGERVHVNGHGHAAKLAEDRSVDAPSGRRGAR
jgi:hypothetical protein